MLHIQPVPGLLLGNQESSFCTGQIPALSCGKDEHIAATNYTLKHRDSNVEREGEKDRRLGNGDRLEAHSLTEP